MGDLTSRQRELILDLHAPNAVRDQDRDTVSMSPDELRDVMRAAFQAGYARAALSTLMA